MSKKLNKKAIVVTTVTVCTVALAGAQFKALLKVVGIGAAVNQFGPQINSALNKLQNHSDSSTMTTKVVPIISGGISSRQAIGAAQVMGPRYQVEKVNAVAQLDQDLLGREIKIRAMIPIETKEIVKDIRRVEGVGISGIVDLKL